MLARLRSLVRALAHRRTFETDLDEELGAHIEQYTQDLVRSGMSPEDAHRRARLELGGVNTVKDECRRGERPRRVRCVPAGVPVCRPSTTARPWLSGTVVLTFALSIGANTAIFSLVNALLLEANAVRTSRTHRHAVCPNVGARVGGRRQDHRWRAMGTPARRGVVAGPCGVRDGDIRGRTCVGFGRSIRSCRLESRHGISTFWRSIPSWDGRFSEDEDRPHGPKVAILSYAMWQSVLGGTHGRRWAGRDAEGRAVHGRRRPARGGNDSTRCRRLHRPPAEPRGGGEGGEFRCGHAVA